jgi:hypothetical protein
MAEVGNVTAVHVLVTCWGRRVADMQPHQIKDRITATIDDWDTRKAIRIMNNIHEAHELMAELPCPHLEALRDAFREMARERSGPRGALKQAWYEYAQQMLDDARKRERKGVVSLYDIRPRGGIE